MPGFSLTLLLLPSGSEHGAPDTHKLLSLLDQPANVPGWKWTVGKPPSDKIITPEAAAATAGAETAVTRVAHVPRTARAAHRLRLRREPALDDAHSARALTLRRE